MRFKEIREIIFVVWLGGGEGGALFWGFLRHNSSLVCMVRITYVYIDLVFRFHGYFFLFFFYLIPIFTA